MSGLDLRANPYVGLKPFFIEDSLYFFGREQQTAELMEILRQHRFLGVVGSSGSGKSSLVRAGLLPGLLGGFLVQDRDRWRTLQIKPGDAPMANLASGLVGAMEQKPGPEEAIKLEQNIREGHTDAVLDFLQSRLESNANLFLLVDQFEEIFAFRGTQRDEGERILDIEKRKDRARRKAEAADFVDLLLSLTRQRKLPIYVVLTMRTDFLGDCDLFFGLPEALNKGRYLVPRMNRSELRAAVECPALLFDVEVSPRLLDHVLNELGDRFDRLPVLQHALLRTWDEWQKAGHIGPIDLVHFESTGGLEGALAKDAERALQGLDIDITERIFKRLTDTDQSQRRVRHPARISELMAVTNADRDTVETVISRFMEDSRNFVHGSADGNPDDPRIDISHESLIRQWSRLRNWVDQERFSRDQYLDLVQQSRAWGGGDAALLWPPSLHVALDWRDNNKPSPAWADRYAIAGDDFNTALGYLDKSVAERCIYLAKAELKQQWRKWARFIIASEVIIAVAIAVGYKLLVKAQEIEHAPGAIINAISESSLTPIRNLDWSFAEVWGQALLFFGGCFLLNHFIKLVHQKLAFPEIQQTFKALGGRDPVKADEEDEKAQTALMVHQTEYASAVRRFAGFAIDFAIYFIVLIIIIAFIPYTEYKSGEPNLVVTYSYLVIFGWLYSTLQITSKAGATLGMRALGIFRTDIRGKPLSFARASALYFLRFLSYSIFFLGFLSQAFTPRRQTFHDWAARSVVLKRANAGDRATGDKGKTENGLFKVLKIVAYTLIALFLILFVIGIFV